MLKRPKTLAEFTALRERVDFEELLEQWKRGERRPVAELLALLGDLAVIARFAVVVYRHGGGLDASNAFAELVDNVASELDGGD